MENLTAGWARAGAALVLALAIGSAVPAQERVASEEAAVAVFKERLEFMESLGAAYRMIRQFAAGRVSAEDAAAAAERIAAAPDRIPLLFPDGSGMEANPKSEASPAIWERWDEFEAASAFLRERAEEFASAIESDDAGLISAAAMALGREGCGGCHGLFRADNR